MTHATIEYQLSFVRLKFEGYCRRLDANGKMIIIARFINGKVNIGKVEIVNDQCNRQKNRMPRLQDIP